ncbi:auxin efflux carrier [Leucosporidium creatinivorum]|uniref:Auxin efflux carrier n=1 Tax=Leucosporidium creatinivorum TaxID=106004 RepID=A0A1Y2FD36_9BASI|nr:auxin efflux carrier [Leucosporidium creatinivorum]
MSNTPAANAIIWLAVKPLLRVAFPAGVGFLLTKTGRFPASGTRAASVLILNMTLPCLLWSKIVPSFNNDNISALGRSSSRPSSTKACLARWEWATTPTPKRFRYGIISSYAFSNWGDLPTGIAQTLMASAPFNGADDEALAIAYIAIFILVNYITMFPLQYTGADLNFTGLRCVRMDYEKPSSIDPVLERRYEEGEWGTAWKWVNRLRRGMPMAWELLEDKDKRKDKMVKKEEEDLDMAKAMEEVLRRENEGKGGDVNLSPDRDAIQSRQPSPTRSTGPQDTDFPALAPTPSLPSSSRSNHPSPYVRVLHSITTFFGSLVSPPTVALLSALIIALIPTLKSLFVYTSESSFHPTAPDGDPPLAVVYSTASFVGAASVPLGLTVLGSSMAKMEIPRPISRLPLASIGAMAFVKVMLLPIIGFFFVEALVKHTGMVAANNGVLRFTLIYFSCVPTGTIQIAYSQMYAPEGEANNSALLSAYILVQYVVYVFSSVILTAMALKTIF